MKVSRLRCLLPWASLLLLVLQPPPTSQSFQLNGIERYIINSILRMRKINVKLVEYFHESLSVPVFAFLVNEHKALPHAVELLGKLITKGGGGSRLRREERDESDREAGEPETEEEKEEETRSEDGNQLQEQASTAEGDTEGDTAQGDAPKFSLKNLFMHFQAPERPQRLDRKTRRYLDY